MLNTLRKVVDGQKCFNKRCREEHGDEACRVIYLEHKQAFRARLYSRQSRKIMFKCQVEESFCVVDLDRGN